MNPRNASPAAEDAASWAVWIEGLTKTYHLYDRHSDRLKEALHPLRKKYHRDFHALHEVSLRVSPGEALGIMGRNGSGKSTLLKIIAGVLTPTRGTALVHGAVSALLELGTGFNPEFTGLENIFFSGTILGRERKEMESFVPEIVSFADIGPYIHQPVKTYSSGMFARLAFAVAAAVDPDILIVDEALSVGDMRFQQKCIRKMQSFRDQGKTILFVTHDTVSIATFCDRALWLDQGRIRELGDVRTVCKRYASFMIYGEETRPAAWEDPDVALAGSGGSSDDACKAPLSMERVAWEDLAQRESFGRREALIPKAALLDAATGRTAAMIRPGQPLRLLMQVAVLREFSSIGFGFLVKNRHGHSIFSVNNWQKHNNDPIQARPGTLIVTFSFTFPSLAHGRYLFTLAVGEGSLARHVQHHWVHDALAVEVSGGDIAHVTDCVLALPGGSWSMDIAINQAGAAGSTISHMPAQ